MKPPVPVIPSQDVRVFSGPKVISVVVASDNGARQAMALTPEAARQLSRLLDAVAPVEIEGE